MEPIYFFDRTTGEKKRELVYGERAIGFLYGKNPFGRFFAYLLARIPFFSYLYGFWQKRSWTKKKIEPFISTYQLDSSEFLLPVNAFNSFNDFFIRELKPEVRPITPGKDRAIIPGDGCYFFYPQIDDRHEFTIKAQKFCLETLLQDKKKAAHYLKGSMVLVRLSPTDYHRFHFPCECIPGPARMIKGPLYSVNPGAVRQKAAFLFQNKRMITELESEEFGKILYVEVGATCVGSIHQTFQPYSPQAKGSEKGFFSFGGSALVLLFEPDRIKFDADLIQTTSENIEIRCLLGQSMGRAINNYLD